MKVYEKPKLIAMSLSGNNRLCGDCADKTKLFDNEYTARAILLAADRDPGYDGISGISRGDFEGLFGTAESCGTPIEAYCKFTSTGEQVAWS